MNGLETTSTVEIPEGLFRRVIDENPTLIQDTKRELIARGALAIRVESLLPMLVKLAEATTQETGLYCPSGVLFLAHNLFPNALQHDPDFLQARVTEMLTSPDIVDLLDDDDVSRLVSGSPRESFAFIEATWPDLIDVYTEHWPDMLSLPKRVFEIAPNNIDILILFLSSLQDKNFVKHILECGPNLFLRDLRRGDLESAFFRK